ncbi:hypothetical protein SALBM217S_09381 [Streptomyces griseoloalbus]
MADCRTDELEVTASDVTIEGDTVGTVAVEFADGGRLVTARSRVTRAST